jgi:wyosine [tRNA(Phe)-imidazoG37] synthetase (radical SAM superfamily)
VKTSLVGQTFEEPEQLLEAITEFLNEIQPPEVVAVFSNWVEMMRRVLENNEDYYHEEIHLLGKHFLIHLSERWRHSLLTALYLCPSQCLS